MVTAFVWLGAFLAIVTTGARGRDGTLLGEFTEETKETLCTTLHTMALSPNSPSSTTSYLTMIGA